MVRTTVEIADSDFPVVRDFVARKAGLYFSESKREELLTVVQDRLGMLPQHRDLAGYLAALERDDDDGRELRSLVGRLTVGETYFFRNRSQFALLRDHLLPELIQRRRGRRQRLRLWSAGCSTGEEAYSLAILLHELLPDVAAWEVHLLATDINEDAVAAAREGVYRSWSFREVEEHYRERYFTAERESFRIRPEVRSLVTFRCLNLAEEVYPRVVTGTDAMDLILCRNVMIYFRPESCVEITRRFFSCLEEQGALLVGHSEHSDLVYPGFSRVFFGRSIVYRKSGQNPTWEKGLALRFRGSGAPPKGIVTHAPKDARHQGLQRPTGTEETVLFERGVMLVGQMRPLEAVAEFRRVLALNPRNERALYSIALLLANVGDTAEATACAERALAVNPLHLEATYLLAILARETGRRERELELLKRAVYLNPDFILGHFQTGLHYRRTGNQRLARRSLLNALRLLRDLAAADPVDGVEGMTVGRLRDTILGMIPGGAPGEEER